jgi:hypothetical protein
MFEKIKSSKNAVIYVAVSIAIFYAVMMMLNEFFGFNDQSDNFKIIEIAIFASILVMNRILENKIK